MNNILIIQHQSDEDEGYIKQWLETHQFEAHRWKVWLNEPVAAPSNFDGVIILGGEANVKDKAETLWMQTEFDWLEQALRENVPCFGICLGAQILASLLGAEVHSLKEPEKGVKTLQLDNRKVLADFPASRLKVNQAHSYRFDIPDNCQSLAESVLCKQQLFVHNDNRVLGIQCHLEWTADTMRRILPDVVSLEDLSQLKVVETRALLFHLLNQMFRK